MGVVVDASVIVALVVAEMTARMRRRHATDVAYVCLAQRLGTTLHTLDRSLARNATALRLPVELV